MLKIMLKRICFLLTALVLVFAVQNVNVYAAPSPAEQPNTKFFPVVHCPSGAEIPNVTVIGITVQDYPADAGIQTAIGCIPTASITNFVAFLLKWALGAAGGVIIVMLIATGYSLVTSQGDPQKVQAVKENITSILAGLILIGFSLILLKAVGADVLQLPGF